MNSIAITAITSVVSGFVGYGFFVLQENKKMKIRLAEKDQERKDALKKQRQEMLEDIERTQSLEITALIDLHIADIKQYLYDMHYTYMEKGYMPGFLKETLQAKFGYYSSHGGNGHGEHLFNEMMSLPERDPKE